MRRLLIIALLVTSTIGWAGTSPYKLSDKALTDGVFEPFPRGSMYYFGTCGNGYSVGPIEVKLQRAIGSDQTNFVYGGIITDTRFKTAANGGQVQNTANNAMSISGPADFVVCDASASGNLLSFDIPQYSATTGTLELYFLQATLHTASTDSVYIFVNNSGVVTSQQDSGLGTNANFYSTAGFAEYCHEPDGSTLNPKCSLSQGTVVNHGAGATAGWIGGAASFVRASSQYIDLGSPVNNSTITVEVWANPSTFNACQRILSNLANPTYNGIDFLMGFDHAAGGSCVANGRVNWQVGNAGNLYQVVSQVPVQTSAWTSFAITQTGTTVLTYQNGVAVAPITINTARTIGTSGTNMNIGRWPGGASDHFNGAIGPVRISSSVRSANWLATSYSVDSYPAFQIVGATYTQPTIVNMTSCATTDMTSGSFSCKLPLPVTSGGVMVYAAGNTDFDCSVKPTDGLGLTLTQQVIADFTGTIQHYYNCQYTAPITATGTDTITSGTGNYTAVIYELKGVTTTGIATAAVNNTSPVGALTATCGGTTCFLLCSENLTQSTGPTYDTYGNSEGYMQALSPEALPMSNDHRAQTYTAYGNVASGSRTCTITGTGQAGTLMLLPNSPSTSIVRHRIVNH